MPRVYSNRAVYTSLSTALALNGTEITVAVGDTTGWPTPGAGDTSIGAIDVGDQGLVEIFSYTGLTGTSFTGVVRGLDGTTKPAHSVGAKVRHIASASDIQAIDTKQALSDIVGAKVYRNSAQSIANITITEVAFTTEANDPSDMWVSGTPGRLTVPTGKGGRWLVGAAVIWGEGNAGNRRYLRIRKNGTTTVAIDDRPRPHVATGHYPTNLVVGEVNLAAADYVTAEVYQDSGVALSILGSAAEADVHLWARRLGP